MSTILTLRINATLVDVYHPEWTTSASLSRGLEIFKSDFAISRDLSDAMVLWCHFMSFKIHKDVVSGVQARREPAAWVKY